jgi:hypothetical protein
MGIFYEHAPLPFLIVTIALGGGAAWMAGSALARAWRPLALVMFYMALLGLGVRFFHYALGDGSLLSAHYLAVDTIYVMLVAALSYRLARASQMVQQYPWLYRRTSPLTWAAK